MAEIKKKILNCPKCGKEMEIDMWNAIEIPYDMDQKEKIVKNTFFKRDCPNCNANISIVYKCQYNDMEQKYLIWLMPRYEDFDQNEVEAYNQKLKEDKRLRLAQGGYRYRIVRNDNELREKVLIFDEGLDDRYIETMKQIYIADLKRTIAKNSRILGLYFDKKEDGTYQWVIIFDNKKPIVEPVNMKLYEDMKVRLKKIVEERTPEGFVQIYPVWAREIMLSPVDNIDTTFQ